MWNHMQPHLYNNETHLEYEMMLNKAFAEVSDRRFNHCFSDHWFKYMDIAKKDICMPRDNRKTDTLGSTSCNFGHIT